MLKLHNKEYDNLNDKNLILWNTAHYAEMNEEKKVKLLSKLYSKHQKKIFYKVMYKP